LLTCAHRIITYVLLCGYSPFRSDDPKELIRETTAAKVEFQTQYWKNISDAAKDFIKSLLKADPNQRPTAAQALASAWLTTHKAENEVDLSGLRENFDPKARWKAAILRTRAMVRLGSGTKSSGGWQNELEDSDDDEEDDDLVMVSSNPSEGGESKDGTIGEDDDAAEEPRGSSSSSPRDQRPNLFDSPKQDQSSTYGSAKLVDSPTRTNARELGHDDDDLDIRIPGSFSDDDPDPNSHGESTAYSGWVSVLRKLTLRS